MHICPSYLSFILYNPIRKLFTDRARIVLEAGVNESSVVLEAGAGNGFLTEVLVQRASKVLAMDVQQGMVKKLRRRMSAYGDRVDVILGDVATYALKEESIDVAIFLYSFHEITNQTGAVLNMAKAVRPGGFVAVYEPKVEVNRRDMENLVEKFEFMGFEKDREHENMFTRFARLRKVRRVVV